MIKNIVKAGMIAALSFGILTGVTGCTPKVPKESSQTQLPQSQSPGEVPAVEKNEKCKPILEVRQKAYEDLKNATNRTSYLLFEDINPYCPEQDTVYNIKKKGSVGYYKGIDNEKDMLEEQFSFVKKLLGEEVEALDIEKFETDYYWMGRKSGYGSFEEFLNDTEENAKRKPVSLGYYTGNQEGYRYSISVYPTFERFTFDRGIRYAEGYLSGSDSDGGNIEFAPSEKVATHYVYTADQEALQKKWKLKDGELSVQEGIDFVENFLNHEVQLEGDNEEILMKVQMVEVWTLADYYYFKYEIRPMFCNLGKQVEGKGGGMPTGSYSSSDVTQLEIKKLDSVDYVTRRRTFEKTKEIKEILPLADAIEILENSVSKNAEYRIYGVELGYYTLSWMRDGYEIDENDNGMELDENGELVTKIIDYSLDYGEWNSTVCWIFRWQNQLDNQYGVFSVNAETGEVLTDTWRPNINQ